MPEERPRYELIEGELCEREAPTDERKKALRKLQAFIAPFAEPSGEDEPPAASNPTTGDP